MIDLERRKRGEDDPVHGAMEDELLPPEQELEGPEQEREERPEDQHVEVPPEELARMAGIQPSEPAAAAPAPQEAAPVVEAQDTPAVAQDLGHAEETLAARAPESEHAEEQHEEHDEQIAGGEFGPQMAVDAEQQKQAQPEPSQAPVDGKAALAAAAGAAAHVAEAAHAEEKSPAPHAGADGFAGMSEVKGKQKWNEDAHYKHDHTSGFDVGGTRAVALGKGQDGKVDAADAAVYATAAVETSGTYDAIQTYDKGILSFGIMQWTLHQGSLMKFLDYLKSKCGDDGKAAFHEHFDALGIDVSGETLLVGGQAIKPDDAGRKQMDQLVRADKETTRRWVVAFHEAGKDERVARAQWTYTKKQYTETAGKSLEKYVGFARKKGYSARHAGSYRTPSFWCRDPEAAALFFSMTANNPGYSYYGVIKAADAFMDAHGPDPQAWPEDWTKQFLSIYAAILPGLIGSWQERVAKTLQHLHLAQEGKSAPVAATHHERPKPPAEHAAPPRPAEIKHAAQAPQPAPEEHHGLRWLADVMTRKVVRGIEDAGTAALHFLGIAQTGTPHAANAPAPAHAPAPAPSPKTHELAKKIEAAAPKTGKSPNKGKLITKDKLSKGKLTDDEYAFKQKVYEQAVGEKAAKKPAFGVMPKEELGEIEGKELRKDVVPHAHTLLSALRDALARAKSAGDEKAMKVKEIGVSSGYRDPEKDFGLWDTYYSKYYEQTHEARAKTGDPHGEEAVKILVRYIAPRKAPPGFSNHSGGTAMDLHAVVDGHVLGADFNNQARWHESWVWKWLCENATSFNFHPYDKEAWHWEWKD